MSTPAEALTARFLAFEVHQDEDTLGVPLPAAAVLRVTAPMQQRVAASIALCEQLNARYVEIDIDAADVRWLSCVAFTSENALQPIPGWMEGEDRDFCVCMGDVLNIEIGDSADYAARHTEYESADRPITGTVLRLSNERDKGWMLGLRACTEDFNLNCFFFTPAEMLATQRKSLVSNNDQDAVLGESRDVQSHRAFLRDLPLAASLMDEAAKTLEQVAAPAQRAANLRYPLVDELGGTAIMMRDFAHQIGVPVLAEPIASPAQEPAKTDEGSEELSMILSLRVTFEKEDGSGITAEEERQVRANMDYLPQYAASIGAFTLDALDVVVKTWDHEVQVERGAEIPFAPADSDKQLDAAPGP